VRPGGAVRARLLGGAFLASVLVSAGVAQSVAGPGVTAHAATAAAADACSNWLVDGTWNTQTPPLQPVFVLDQNGTTISGTERFSPADAAAAGLPNPTAKVIGTLVGDQIDIVATFHGVLKLGARAAGTLQAEYKGTITTGSVTGTGQDITTPGPKVAWSGRGPAECGVTIGFSFAASKRSPPNGAIAARGKGTLALSSALRATEVNYGAPTGAATVTIRSSSGAEAYQLRIVLGGTYGRYDTLKNPDGTTEEQVSADGSVAAATGVGRKCLHQNARLSVVERPASRGGDSVALGFTCAGKRISALIETSTTAVSIFKR
jgi:hypothetical protein